MSVENKGGREREHAHKGEDELGGGLDDVLVEDVGHYERHTPVVPAACV